jgi:hypothetical protein
MGEVVLLVNQVVLILSELVLILGRAVSFLSKPVLLEYGSVESTLRWARRALFKAIRQALRFDGHALLCPSYASSITHVSNISPRSLCWNDLATPQCMTDPCFSMIGADSDALVQ